MGTTGSTANEWIELYNNTGSSIDLTNWTLKAADNTPSVTLSGSIGAYGHYLLERTDDDSVPGVAADRIYTGAMVDSGELLVLRDDSSNVIDSANQSGSCVDELVDRAANGVTVRIVADAKDPLTVNDTFGSEANRTANIRSGHTNHGVEIRSAGLAAAYTAEFEEMWGGTTATPGITTSNFHGRKTDNGTHQVYVGGKLVEVYFSPSEGALARVNQIVSQDADVSARFCIYAFSDQTLTDNLKYLWEGSTSESTGTLTGFKVQGVFDSGFWDPYWSASLDMTARDGDPDQSIKWNNEAPVGFDGEDKLLHHKYMIVDEGTASDPFVITGSMNWSANGEDTNDENTVIIHDAAIANQFYQEFAARYYAAYGIVDFLR